MPKNRNDFHSIPNPSTSRLRLIKTLVLAGGLSALPGLAQAATLQTIYTFPASGASGCYPDGTLLRDATDALYGATGGCPISQINTVFKLTPPLPGQMQWKASVLHSFSGGFDGLTPNADLVKDANGALYGTAMDAGAGLQGVVFQLKPPAPGQTSWTENVLHAFNYNVAYGIGDGAFPGAGVILDDQGALYGTTLYGGSMSDPRWVGFGAVFQLKPPAAGQSTWQHTVLYRFRGGADGESPFAGLTLPARFTAPPTAAASHPVHGSMDRSPAAARYSSLLRRHQDRRDGQKRPCAGSETAWTVVTQSASFSSTAPAPSTVQPIKEATARATTASTM